MSPQAATHPAAPYATLAARLLTAGIAAGPLFLGVWAMQAFTRTGFDPSRHPLSLLSLGNLGWIQIANFAVTGALYLACAACDPAPTSCKRPSPPSTTRPLPPRPPTGRISSPCTGSCGKPPTTRSSR